MPPRHINGQDIHGKVGDRSDLIAFTSEVVGPSDHCCAEHLINEGRIEPVALSEIVEM
jgi:hypothetical protein